MCIPYSKGLTHCTDNLMYTMGPALTQGCASPREHPSLTKNMTIYIRLGDSPSPSYWQNLRTHQASQKGKAGHHSELLQQPKPLHEKVGARRGQCQSWGGGEVKEEQKGGEEKLKGGNGIPLLQFLVIPFLQNVMQRCNFTQEDASVSCLQCHRTICIIFQLWKGRCSHVFTNVYSSPFILGLLL